MRMAMGIKWENACKLDSKKCKFLPRLDFISIISPVASKICKP